jgi:hypothetical protein
MEKQMSNEIQNVKIENVEEVIAEIEDAFYDIPFGNTGFQTKAFVLAAGITPERTYRAVGLQMLNGLNNIRTSIYHQKKSQIDMDEKREKLNDPEISIWEKKRIELDLEFSDTTSKYNEKLLNDSIVELNLIYSEFKKLPKFTREQFENAEHNYFTQSLERQARGISGPVESLINMREDAPALSLYKEKLLQLEKIDTETLEKLRLSLPNQLHNANPEFRKENQKVKLK